MDQQQIKAFIDAMSASDLSEMEFSQDGWTLRLTRRGAEPSSPAASRSPSTAARSTSARTLPAEAAAPDVLPAPLYGVVHLQQAPGEPPFVAIGARVRAGQTLCVIEAMKVFNEVRAEHDATVVEVLVQSGQEVEAGQPLFRFA